MKEALLVIDMLNDFTLGGAPLRVPENQKRLVAMQREVARARAEDVPVIYVCDSHEPDDREFEVMGWPPHAVKGTEGARVVDELAPEAGDEVVEKNTYSGFYQTRLEELLRARGIEALTIIGCVTDICIMHTASDAALRGFTVRVPRDAAAPLDPEEHEFALRHMENILGVAVV